MSNLDFVRSVGSLMPKENSHVLVSESSPNMSVEANDALRALRVNRPFRPTYIALAG
jgi:hypothetical protein